MFSCFASIALTESVSVYFFPSAAEPGRLCGLRQSPQPGVQEVRQKRVRVYINGRR